MRIKKKNSFAALTGHHPVTQAVSSFSLYGS